MGAATGFFRLLMMILIKGAMKGGSRPFMG
jgi:hypothetical protein